MENKIIFFSVLFCNFIIFIAIVTIIIFLLIEKEEDKENWENYDCYIFSVFWPASSCYNKNENKEACYERLKELNIKNNFIIHGLWPTYLSGEYSGVCNPNDEINATFSKEYETNLSKVWPGLYSSDSNMWNHEYNKHGYCYIKRIEKNPEKDYQIYFNKTLQLFQENTRNFLDIMLPDTSKGFHTISKQKFFSFALNSKLDLESDEYSLRCTTNKETNITMLSEIWFNLNLDMLRTKDLKLSDNCPDRFELYFIDETKIPVYEKYDFYVLSLVWMPTICFDRDKDCIRDLKRRVLEDRDNLNMLTIHGLWPSYKTGIFPQWCNIDEDIEIINYTKDMKNYWMNAYEENENTDEEFWGHEYNRHGLCYNQRINVSGNDYLYYFNKTIDVYHQYNLKSVLRDAFKDMFAGINEVKAETLINYLDDKFGINSTTLTCNKYDDDYYLHEIRFKLDMNFNMTSEGKTINDCPDIFNIEFLEVEGPQKQDDNFYKLYDMYFYTILWLGTTCHMKGKQCYERIKHVPKNVFTVHGLWPNYRNGTLPDWCHGDNDIEIDIHDKELGDFMNKYYVSGYHTQPYFWGHEYNKHGSCYNLRQGHNVNDYEIFFKITKDMFVNNNFENLFLDFFEKEKIDIIKGDMAINRTKFERFFDERGFNKHHYVIVCTNITDKNETIYNPHILEIRIRYDLDFNLLKNDTDKSEFDCPETFYAQFL